jgi:Fuc2NAc and GlcNAc transferase
MLMIRTISITFGILFVGTVVGWALTRVILIYARSRSLIDIPNDRSSHHRPTPRGGGLSMVIVFLAGLGGAYWLDLVARKEFLALLGGTVLVAGIGFWDDHQDVRARWRILIHFVAAFWSLAWIGGFPAFSILNVEFAPGALGYPLGALFLVWLLNLFNFMDGIAGIAGSEGLFISSCAALICILGKSTAGPEGDLIILTVLASSCLGFLLWNWPPASIFMGDVGSGFLGFVLGVIALITAHKGLLSIWFWLILFGVFIADASVTLLRRVVRGERWYEAHRSHAYQHASRRYRSHRVVTFAISTINLLWLLPLAVAAWLWPAYGFFLACVAWIPLFAFAYRFGAGMV